MQSVILTMFCLAVRQQLFISQYSQLFSVRCVCWLLFLTVLKLTGDQVEYTPDLWHAILCSHSRLHTIELQDRFKVLNETMLLALARACISLRKFSMMETLRADTSFSSLVECFPEHVQFCVVKWSFVRGKPHHQYEVTLLRQSQRWTDQLLRFILIYNKCNIKTHV